MQSTVVNPRCEGISDGKTQWPDTSKCLVAKRCRERERFCEWLMGTVRIAGKSSLGKHFWLSLGFLTVLKHGKSPCFSYAFEAPDCLCSKDWRQGVLSVSVAAQGREEKQNHAARLSLGLNPSFTTCWLMILDMLPNKTKTGLVLLHRSELPFKWGAFPGQEGMIWATRSKSKKRSP